MRLAFVNPQGNFDPVDSYLTAHPDFGGQLVYVREVALALAAMGHQADILTRQITDPNWPEFAAAEDYYPGQPNVRVLRFPCGPQRFLSKEELWPYLGEWVGNIARWYRREGLWPDLWTGHYADGGLSAALLEEHSGVPFTFTSHSLGAWKLDRLLAPDVSFAAVELSADELLPALDAHYNFGARVEAERAAMARAATIITNSNRGRYCLHDHPAYRDAADVEDDRRFAVIPPGVNLAVFDAGSRSPREGQIREAIAAALARDVALERRGLPAVIAWSRLDPKKNHLALVRAFAHWPGLREHANLIMITRGLDDPLRELETATPNEQAVLRPIVNEVEQADLWGCVSAFSLAGQDAVAALYRWGAQTGGVFCLPAKHEPFGLSVIEAMASGLPVVATSNGGPQEITDGGRAGLLADPDDYAELAEQLLRLIGDPKAWRTYAARGRERVLKLYNWHRTAEDYARLAREISRGERAGDASFPLPDFVCLAGPVELPRLESWEPANVLPSAYCS
jgi:sucrose-phosphate synthase